MPPGSQTGSWKRRWSKSVCHIQTSLTRPEDGILAYVTGLQCSLPRVQKKLLSLMVSLCYEMVHTKLVISVMTRYG